MTDSDDVLLVDGLEVVALSNIRGTSGRMYSGVACCCIRAVDRPRLWAIQVLEWRPFDPFILSVIICNCITMAVDSPLDPCCTPKAAFLEAIEWVYLAVFTCEMVCASCICCGLPFA